MKPIKIRWLLILQLIVTLIVIWGLAFLKIAWATTEVDVFLDDGNYFLVDEDGRSYEPIKIHLDSRFMTIRTAIQLSWFVYSILTLIAVAIRFHDIIDLDPTQAGG